MKLKIIDLNSFEHFIIFEQFVFATFLEPSEISGRSFCRNFEIFCRNFLEDFGLSDGNYFEDLLISAKLHSKIQCRIEKALSLFWKKT